MKLRLDVSFFPAWILPPYFLSSHDARLRHHQVFPESTPCPFGCLYRISLPADIVAESFFHRNFRQRALYAHRDVLGILLNLTKVQ
jgi:hypothetical protein